MQLKKSFGKEHYLYIKSVLPTIHVLLTIDVFSGFFKIIIILSMKQPTQLLLNCLSSELLHANGLLGFMHSFGFTPSMQLSMENRHSPPRAAGEWEAMNIDGEENL